MLITRSEVIGFFGAIGKLYLLAFIIVAIVVVIKILKKAKTKKGKFFGSIGGFILVCAIFYGWLMPDIMKHYKRKARYQTAKVLFDEKCKTAGEKIYRTVDDVEGVTLLRVYSYHKSNIYTYNPMWEEAAISQPTEYIYSFLGVTFHDYSHGTFQIGGKADNPQQYAYHRKPYTDPIFGYNYVDVKEDNSYARYTLPWGGGDKIATPLQTKPARYAVTYETNVNPDERKYWIANATIQIIDTKDNSLMAEKVIYVFDHGLGGGARGTSGRQPWSHAEKCPNNKIKNNTARFFTEKVLKPKQPTINLTNGE